MIAGRESGSFRTPHAEIPPLDEPCEFCVVAQRTDSLGSRTRWLVFGSLCLVSFTLAAGFAAMGAWLVLPYSAVEMAFVFAAFRYVERRSGDWERLAVVGDRVLLERASAGTYDRQEFNRLWVKVEMDAARFGNETRLALRYAGRRVPFGSDMPEPERKVVASRLRRALAGA